MVKKNIRTLTYDDKNIFARAFRLISYTLLGLGFLLIASFIYRGGPNRGEGTHFFDNEYNLYLDAQIGLVLIAAGMLIFGATKILKRIETSDKILTVVIKIQIVISTLGLITIATASDHSLAPLGAYYSLYIFVPLVVIVMMLSIFRFKKLASHGYPLYVLMGVIANWIAAIWMTIRVTD